MARFGWHLHTLPTPAEIALQKLNSTGGNVARLDGNWALSQLNQPTIAFNTASFGYAGTDLLTNSAYDNYLRDRGYHNTWYSSEVSGNPRSIWFDFDALKDAKNNNVAVIWNALTLPSWTVTGSGSILTAADKTAPGTYLADLIIYTARQANGFAILQNVEAWQMFNEVNVIYGESGSSIGGVPLLPYTDYFKMVDHAVHFTNLAYTAINWSANTGNADRPAVSGPSLAGVYDPSFLNALFAYVPLYGDTTNAQGNLDIKAMSLHPYGARVSPWDSPETPLNPSTDPTLTATAQTNLTFGRVLLPTDDILTWKSLVERDQSNTSIDYKLFLYSTQNNPADQYFERNTELGVERSMTLIAREGYGNIDINFTEWGASTYVGSLSSSVPLENTTFADPFKYGYYPSNQLLTEALTYNLQAETVAQSLGLFESWDFVENATIYEIYDDTAYPNSDQGHYGIATGADANGNPIYKPAGQLYANFMAGLEYHKTDFLGATNIAGVDIHMAASGVNGTFNSSLRQIDHHEVLLMREGNDTVSGNGGDDIIFGGSGNDSITGDAGFDRLYGGSGNDILSGGANDDRIKGDDGDDTLTGGTGKDGFIFSAYGTIGSGYGGQDTITDFVIGEDTIMVIGGYTTGVFANTSLYPNLMTDVAGGVKIYYADNGASITLLGNTKASIMASLASVFLTFEGDTTVGYTPPTGGNTINGTAGADTLNGTASAETLNGLAGNDSLFGLGGNDTLNGGDGDDWLIGGAGADVIDGGLGWDLLEYYTSGSAVTVNLATGVGSGGDAAGDTYTGIETISGSDFDDTLTGDANYNNIWGGLGADTVYGGGETDNVWGGDGADVIYGETGNDSLSGDAGNDSLFGDAGIDTLLGGDGDDWLIGGAGADTVNGGAGFDLLSYHTAASGVSVNLGTGSGSLGDALGDVLSLIEAVSGSTFDDTLIGDANYNNIFGNSGNDSLDGGGSNDSLWGEGGNDTLNGGVGDDTLYGNLGDDTFIVDSALDTVVEVAGEGNDLVQASVTITALAANVERLTLTGTAALNGTGNASNNIITGNSGANTLNGGGGVDTLIGGAGNDIYVVDTTTDTITELASGGTDTVQSTVTFTLGSNVERLTLTGTANIDGNGNALANVITGNSGNNFILGGAGADTLNGGAGTDLVEYYTSATAVTVNLALTTAQVGGDAAGDILSNFENIGGSNAGNDTLTGNAGSNGIWGNGGNDTITGAGGNDTLAGGVGNDTFVFATGFGADQVNDFSAGVGVVDRLRLLVGTSFDTYAEIYAATTQVGANSVITISANDTITLLNVTKTTLVADDFLFV